MELPTNRRQQTGLATAALTTKPLQSIGPGKHRQRADLKVDCFLDLPNDVGLVTTPLVVDGTLCFTGTMNVIRAVDAVTGELLREPRRYHWT